jgi:hypothetical protein
VTSLGVVSYSSGPIESLGYRSTVTANRSNITIAASTRIRAAGTHAIAGAGIASFCTTSSGYSPSSSTVKIITVALVTSHSSVETIGERGVASVGFASYGDHTSALTESSSILTAERSLLGVVSSNVTAEGKRAVASVGIAAFASNSQRSAAHVAGCTVGLCSARVKALGEVAVALGGGASTGALVVNRTKVLVSHSIAEAGGECDAATAAAGFCGGVSLVSWHSLSVSAWSESGTVANRFILVGSRLQEISPPSALPSASCATLGDAAALDGVVIVNTSFNCSHVGWNGTTTAVPADVAVVFGIAGLSSPISSLFPGASTDESASAGSLGSMEDATNDTVSTCEALEVFETVVDPTETRTLPVLRTETRTAKAPLRIATRTLHHPVTWRTRSLTPARQVNPPRPASMTKQGFPATISVVQQTSTLTASVTVGLNDIVLIEPPTQPRLIPTAVTAGAVGTAAVVSAVAGLVGVPVASRPAVVGAAIRLSTCVADGDGPEVPPYEAMPVQFAVLSTTVGTAGLAIATNAAFVGLCIVGAWFAAPTPPTPNEVRQDGEEGSMRASIAHVVATVPLSYIGPALAEFSVSWMTAAGTGSCRATAWARGWRPSLLDRLSPWQGGPSIFTARDRPPGKPHRRLRIPTVHKAHKPLHRQNRKHRTRSTHNATNMPSVRVRLCYSARCSKPPAIQATLWFGTRLR